MLCSCSVCSKHFERSFITWTVSVPECEKQYSGAGSVQYEEVGAVPHLCNSCNARSCNSKVKTSPVKTLSSISV